MRQFIYSLPILAFLTATAAAEDAVTIKIAYPKEGQRAKVTVEDKTTTKSAYTIMGNLQSKEDVKTKSLVYIDEIIENAKNAKRATKLKRTYEKAAIGADGKPKALPIEGKTVLIEKKGDKYSFSVDGEAVDGDALKLLEDEFNKPDQDVRDAMLPKKLIKPGETWKIDPEELIKALGKDGATFAKDKVSAGGTLVKAYMKEGKQFGVLELIFEAPITGLGEKTQLTIKEGKLVMKMTGDGCIDGTAATGKSTAKMTLGFTGSTMGIEIKVVVESNENRTMEILPAK